MIHHSFRKALATLGVAAFILTGLSSVPAQAESKDLARALAAIAGIAIVGKLIHDRKKDKKRDHEVVTRRRPVDPIPIYRPHRPRRVDPTPVHPRPLPRRVDRRQLPQHCFRSFDTPQGRFHMFGRQCLKKNYAFVNRLPKHCAQRIRTYNGKRNGFDARCLRREGYSLARG